MLKFRKKLKFNFNNPLSRSLHNLFRVPTLRKKQKVEVPPELERKINSEENEQE